MDNDHGITGELREWFKDRVFMANGWQELLRIADRIDAEHEKAEYEWKAKDGQTWLRGYGKCHAELMEGNKAIAADLERAGWVKLPKDADEYIHEHDKVDWRDHAGTWHENATVVAVCNDGCYVMDGSVFHVHKSDIRHYHKPTVEDVLAELLCEYDRDDFELTELIERFAAKLQLRGGK